MEPKVKTPERSALRLRMKFQLRSNSDTWSLPMPWGEPGARTCPVILPTPPAATGAVVVPVTRRAAIRAVTSARTAGTARARARRGRGMGTTYGAGRQGSARLRGTFGELAQGHGPSCATAV